jgi:hypothetical protein
MKTIILIIGFLGWAFVSHSQTRIDGANGKWEYDGRYIRNCSNWSNKWEYDGHYIRNTNNWSNKWEWDGKYLRNCNNWSNKWEWDGRYLKNTNNWSQKYELPSGVPVPVAAVAYGVIN